MFGSAGDLRGWRAALGRGLRGYIAVGVMIPLYCDWESVSCGPAGDLQGWPAPLGRSLRENMAVGIG